MQVKIMKSPRNGLFFAVCLLAIDITARMVPHAPNFTPIAASALFASFWFERPILAVMVPLAAMSFSDWFIGFYDWRVMTSVYLALAFPAVLGPFIRSKFTAGRVIASAIASSTLFFLLTNFAVWSFASMYPRTLNGLVQCYGAAVPFFRNTLTGDLVWSGVFFGAYGAFRRVLALRALAARTETR